MPIYQSIGVDERKVVRSLLAAMPPGVNIPVHHDTGEWVKNTHRIHVPLLTSDTSVHFHVGTDEGMMRDIAFSEGYVVELNNRAKHSVSNKWDQWRIHLIFDYVDDFPITRIPIHKGQVAT